MKKKVFAIVIALVTLLCCLLCGCKEGGGENEGNYSDNKCECGMGSGIIDENGNELPIVVEKGGIPALQKAYDSGWLTKTDLQMIADYFHGVGSYPEKLNADIDLKIRESAAERLKNDIQNPISEANAEGISIIYYYGKYSGCHVVGLTDIYRGYPTDIPNYWREVGGVRFHIRSHSWCYVYKEIQEV